MVIWKQKWTCPRVFRTICSILSDSEYYWRLPSGPFSMCTKLSKAIKETVVDQGIATNGRLVIFRDYPRWKILQTSIKYFVGQNPYSSIIQTQRLLFYVRFRRVCRKIRGNTESLICTYVESSCKVFRFDGGESFRNTKALPGMKVSLELQYAFCNCNF